MPDNVDEGKSTFEKYLAPNYPYHSGIVTPEHLGMTPNGTMAQLGKNARGLVDYGRILVTGVGGFIGSYYGSVKYDTKTIQKIMGGIIIFAIILLIQRML